MGLGLFGDGAHMPSVSIGAFSRAFKPRSIASSAETCSTAVSGLRSETSGCRVVRVARGFAAAFVARGFAAAFAGGLRVEAALDAGALAAATGGSPAAGLIGADEVAGSAFGDAARETRRRDRPAAPSPAVDLRSAMVPHLHRCRPPPHSSAGTCAVHTRRADPAPRRFSDNPAQYRLSVTAVKGYLGNLLSRELLDFSVVDHAGVRRTAG